MKTKSILISGLSLVILSIVFTSFINKTTGNNSRTEEYAIVEVLESGKTKVIRVTKGNTPGTELKEEKTEERDDFTPVITVLNQLNEQGFELLNASLAYSSIDGSPVRVVGEPRHTFMMVKKIK